MAKKVIRPTEGELSKIVSDVVKDEQMERRSNSENYPSSDELFNLDNISMDVLDRGYVRYAPYNLGITYRHPLRRINEEIDYRKQIEDAKNVIISTYPLSQEQFIIREGHNGMYAAILASLVENNVEVIEKAMLKLGFFRSKPTDDKLLCDKKNRKWIDLRFEPTHAKNLRRKHQTYSPLSYH